MVNVTKRFLGTSTDDERVYLDVKITTSTRAGVTVTHEPVSEYARLSFQGEIHERGGAYGGYHCSAAGQCVETIAAMTWKDGGPFSPAEIAEILAVWDRWHLNDMRPNCVHQEHFSLPYTSGSRYNDEWRDRAAVETAKCPCGYAYGSAWLVEPLPLEIVDKVTGWFGEKA
jgi:hypothetical protein